MLDKVKAYDEVIEKAHKTIVAFKVYPKILHEEKNHYLHPIFDRGLFNAINMVDLITGLKYLDVSGSVNNDFEANYFSRIVAHSSYEILNNQQKIFGKQAADVVERILGGEALKDIKECSKELKIIKKDHFESMKYIRNNLFGHKTESGIELADGIKAVDSIQIYKVGKSIFEYQTRLLGRLVELGGQL